MLLALLVLTSGYLYLRSDGQDEDRITLKGLKLGTNLETALEEAKGQDKLVFVYFRSDSCYWCMQFEGETFTNQSVIKTLNEKFILVSIDVYAQRNETRAFKVRGTPTMVFLDSNGTEIKRIPGYIETETFLNTINTIKDPVYKNGD